MEFTLIKEDFQPKRKIYIEMQRKALEQKALIPRNLNINRRSTQHTRIEKSFEEAYNCSPRTRIAKMRASRNASEAKGTNTIALTPDSPSYYNPGNKFIFENNSIPKIEIFKKISNLYEKERVNTHKILTKMTEFRKTIAHDLSQIGQINFKGAITKRNPRAFTGKKLKENINN